MPIEYANIIRSLNIMQESKARRREADVDSAMKGLQLAQQDKQFELELAFKYTQEARARESFEMEEQKFFMEQAAGLMEKDKAQMDIEAAALYQSVFAGYQDQFVKKIDDDTKALVYSGEKGKGKHKTHDLIKHLQKDYNLTEADAISISGMMTTIKIGGGKNTALIDKLITKWEMATGEKQKIDGQWVVEPKELGDAKAYKTYRDRYKKLDEELNQIQEGDYEFEASKYTDKVEGDLIMGDENLALTDFTEEEGDDDNILDVIDSMSAEELNHYIEQGSGKGLSKAQRQEEILNSQIGQRHDLIGYRDALLSLEDEHGRLIVNPKEQMALLKHNVSITRQELRKTKSALQAHNAEKANRMNASSRFTPTQQQIAENGGINPYDYTAAAAKQDEIETALLSIQIDVLNKELEQREDNYSGLRIDETYRLIDENPAIGSGF
jgi:hypothetical protein